MQPAAPVRTWEHDVRTRSPRALPKSLAGLGELCKSTGTLLVSPRPCCSHKIRLPDHAMHTRPRLHPLLPSVSHAAASTHAQLVDTVCSLGGVPLFADTWGVDCIYSGSQKCLSGPPGASPFFFSERALEVMQKRKTPPATYNLDMNLIGDYWGWFNKRSYHHTGPISTFYA
jgi:hypothetical protein